MITARFTGSGPFVVLLCVCVGLARAGGRCSRVVGISAETILRGRSGWKGCASRASGVFGVQS